LCQGPDVRHLDKSGNQHNIKKKTYPASATPLAISCGPLKGIGFKFMFHSKSKIGWSFAIVAKRAEEAKNEAANQERMMMEKVES